MMCTPVLKWAGGKRTVIPKIEEILNELDEDRVFFDAFGGGGSVSIHFSRRFKSIVFNDINEELLNVYVQIKEEPEKLIKILEKLKENNNKENYYKVRELDRTPNALSDNVFRAARTIYLNKTCYNGLYRVNSKGEFNVPYGRYDKPRIFDKENIFSLSELLRSKIELRNECYESVLSMAKKGDVVYFDPPYDQENGEFSGYTRKSFTKDDQVKLKCVFDKLTQKGVYCILSNSATSFIRNIYSHYIDEQSIILVKRTVGANVTSRAKVEEILISNFKTLKSEDEV